MLSWGQFSYGSVQIYGAVFVRLKKVDVSHSLVPFVQGHGSSSGLKYNNNNNIYLTAIGL